MTLAWDIVRAINLALLAAAIVQTVIIVRLYYKVLSVTRRLLPYHVFLIGMALLGLEVEAAVQTMRRVGQGFTWYLPVNSLLFSLTFIALLFILEHVTRKVDSQSEITPFLDDPDEID